MTKEKARTLLIQIFNTYSNIITANYKDGVIQEAFEMAVEALADRKTENSSGKPNNCDTCKHNKLEWYSEVCDSCCGNNNHYEPKDEPQTEVSIAKALVHKAIDESDIADDAYPNLRQRLHDAVDAYEPQTERSSE